MAATPSPDESSPSITGQPSTASASRRKPKGGRTTYACSACGTTVPRWVGRCPGCEAWNSLEPVRARLVSHPGPAGQSVGPRRVGDVAVESGDHVSTGIAEVDRVLGGGLLPGSVTLVGGEPGVGKSTLLLQVAAAVASEPGRTCLYVSAEESASQVRRRADRLDAVVDDLWLVHEADLDAVLAHVEQLRPDLLVVDSVQTVATGDVGAVAGSITQVRAVASRLVEVAKATGTIVLLVGHVTKDGALAGPRQLEHVVDTVLGFEGDRHHELRLLRTTKHRFGATDELGVFAMGVDGVHAVGDPSALFLSDFRWGMPGAAVAATSDGRRPMLVEVQALVGRGVPGDSGGRRQAIGVPTNRLNMVLAVLSRWCRLPLGGRDIHVAVAGGMSLREPAADLGLALAVASAECGEPVPSDVVAIGEVGLGGELRQVAHIEARLREAARLGFAAAVVPLLTPELAVDIECRRVATLREAIGAVHGTPQESLH